MAKELAGFGREKARRSDIRAMSTDQFLLLFYKDVSVGLMESGWRKYVMCYMRGCTAGGKGACISCSVG